MGDPLIRSRPLPSRACATAVAVWNGAERLITRCAETYQHDAPSFSRKFVRPWWKTPFCRESARSDYMTECVSRRNLSSRSGEERGVIQNVSMTSTACMITSRYKNNANVPMRLGCGDRIIDWMRFTYLEVVDGVFRSLTLTKSDVGVGRAGGSDYVTYFLFGLGV